MYGMSDKQWSNLIVGFTWFLIPQIIVWTLFGLVLYLRTGKF